MGYALEVPIYGLCVDRWGKKNLTSPYDSRKPDQSINKPEFLEFIETLSFLVEDFADANILVVFDKGG